MDKNLWATTVYNSGDTLSQANCGNFYQRWNNYGFPWTWNVTTSSTQVDASSYWPWNYYESDIFITLIGDWSSVQNDNLRWGVTWVLTFENAITNTGVLSVNNQTWAVMVSEFTATDWGTKVFNLPAVWDNVSDIVSWLNSWWQVIFKTLGTIYWYIVTYRNSSTRVINCSLTSNSSSYWTIEYDASSICTSKTSITYKFFNPASAGSQWQVLTKWASGYDWANPSGWDVVVSSQANNILTSWMKIRAGTETNYWNLGTYDQNTLYLTIE